MENITKENIINHLKSVQIDLQIAKNYSECHASNAIVAYFNDNLEKN